MSAQDAQTEEAPQSFVKWSKLSSIISQAVKNGVKCAIVMKPNGALLSVAGNDSSVEKIIGGVVSSVWKSFYDEGVACFGEDQKQQVLIADCENGKLSVIGVGKFLLALYSVDPSLQIGMLMSMTRSLASELHQPLSQVYASTAY